MSDSVRRTGIILLAYGGPDSLSDVPAFLERVRGGRHTPQRLVDEISERYRRIGGRSPLLSITRSVARKLEETVSVPVYVGMRHWRPFIRDVVAQMMDDGIRHIVAICMAPHFSSASIGVYRACLEQALAASGQGVNASFVESWHAQPDYLAGTAANIKETMTRFPREARDRVKVIFTAHSLPAALLDRGDPYDAQLRETAHLLAERLCLAKGSWALCYQSAPRTQVQWLGPQIGDVVVELIGAGEKNLLIAPIGFLSENVEVLFDIDIELRELACSLGGRVERTPMLNDSPVLVTALANMALGCFENDRCNSQESNAIAWKSSRLG